MSEEPQGDAPRIARRRRQKKGNSQNFNSLLSSALDLSVNEQVRLVRSLAGQRGLLVLSAEQVSRLKGEAPHKSVKMRYRDDEPQERPRSNPLKGTAFEVGLNEARAALKRAKEESQGAVLPETHPAYQAYKAQLAAYKEARKHLAPVGGQETPANPKKRTRQLSPVPASSERKGSTGIVSRATSALQTMAGISSASAKRATPKGATGVSEADGDARML
jgi:hypothetical protein